MKKKIIFNKVVRDKSVELLKEMGGELITKELDLDELSIQLKEKLKEEAYEVINAQSLKELTEEIADVLEVIDTMLSSYGISRAEVESLQLQKREKKGGFSKRLFALYAYADEKSAAVTYAQQYPDKYPVVDC